MTTKHKRQIELNSDMNNNELTNSKKTKRSYTIGQIKQLNMINFLCFKNVSMQFHPTHMQIVTGANGSGKSTIANAICLCLGAQARTTGRTANVQSFIRKGETLAELSITLANEGEEAFKPHLYGNEIQIIRKVGPKQSGYKIIGVNGRVISTRKETIDEILQAFSIAPENPLCVLHQEIAKTFLINSDPEKKYQFYMKVSQLDQIKQAYEQGVYTVHLLTQRVNAMKQKHMNMLRELEPLEQEVRKIQLRRDYEDNRYQLEVELRAAVADQTRQELFEVQNELDQIKKSKDDIDEEIRQENKKLLEIDRKLDNYLIEKHDFEIDMNSLEELLRNFLKEKQDIQQKIHIFKQDCDNYRQKLTDIELEQIYLQKQIDKYENLNNESNKTNQDYLDIDHEISMRKDQEIECDKRISLLTNDLNINNENIHGKQTIIEFLTNELKQKEQDFNQLMEIDQEKMNINAPWMSDCLKTIQNDQRFHKKPIGPINRYIHCINSHWSYAVEKHLAPIMSSFICENNDDQNVLTEILSSYSNNYHPMIYIRAYSDKIYDISGTIEYIRQAKLLTIYDVLKIDNVTVENTLIDLKQIEATILVESLEEAKQLRESEALKWKNIDRRVKQVVEAWTCDGSNIKLDGTFRIYTNDKQTIRYFLSNTSQSLSINELETEIKCLNEQIIQMNDSLNEFTANQQTIIDEINQIKKANTNNKRKIRELLKEHDRINATFPVILDCSLNELQEKARNYLALHADTIGKYEESKVKQEENEKNSTDLIEKYQNITYKLDSKTEQYDILIDKFNDEQSKHYEINQKLKKLNKKSTQLNELILKYQNKIKQFTRKQSKKSKKSNIIIRSIRDIQQELNAINNYLQTNQDTKEIRREMIHQYRLKRDAAKEYKQTYERCYQQIDCLKQFIDKRQEGFRTIAGQHQYILRTKFQNLMRKYNFDDSDIIIDHKKAELHIIIKEHQKHLNSLSGGERSISTFCFLLALWESIYQPFRLLDEIDIYMDNEKLHSTLKILYDNTLNYSLSQHIIFTPQNIDSQLWSESNVPVFNMPTPKRLS